MKDKNVLLTGATGFIGQWLLDKLVGLGSNVTVIVRNKKISFFNSLKYDQTEIFYCDIRDYDSIIEIMKKNSFDFVFHLASKNINYGTNFSLINTFDTIIKGTYNILDACRLHGEKKLKIILTSSREVYAGDENNHSILKSYHPYEVSKKTVDLIVQSFCTKLGLSILSIRPPNIFGGGDLNWNRIIPGTMKSIINGEMPVIRTDGSLLREYIYIEDFINTLILLAEKGFKKNIKGHVYDIDRLDAYSSLEIVNRIIDISQKKNIKPIIKNISKDEKFDLFSQSENLINNLGWDTNYTIDRGLRKTWKWYKNYFKI